MKSLTLFFTVYLALLGPSVVLVDVFYITMLFLTFFCLFLIILRLRVAKELYVSFAMAFALSLVSLLFIFINSSFSELELYASFLKLFLFFFSSYSIVYIYNRFSTQSALLHHVYYCVLITSIVSIILLFSPSLRDYIFPFLDLKLTEHRDVINGIRTVDLSIGGGTALSLFFVFGYVIKKEMQFANVFNASFLVTFLGYFLYPATMLSGRTGFLILIILSFIYNVRFLANSRLLHSYKFHLLPMCVFVPFLVYFSMHNWVVLSEVIFPWALEFVYGLFSGQGTASTNDLVDSHYHLGLNNIELLLGIGGFNVGSDVGYIKFWYSLGVIGPILLFLFYIVPMLASLMRINSFGKEIRVSNRVLVLFSFILVLANFKELIFTNSRGLFELYCIVLFLSFYSNRFYSELGKGHD